VIASVKYMVPVWVTIDTDAERVTAVNLQDDAMDQPVAYVDENGLRLLPAEQAAVSAVLGNGTAWPAWETGL
jgi:hypothetical protein